VQDSTRIVRVAPGQKDLKGAALIQLADLQAGDRILVLGKPSDDAESIVASSMIAMKRVDVEAKQQHGREDWQKRGVDGLVSAVDTGSRTITISVTTFGGTNTLAIHTSKDTILRRYAPDSVKFDDARPGTLEQIKPGDQLRARGTPSEDGREFAAEEIVSGSFRNIAGTIISVDTAASTMSVKDLITKKPLLVKVTADSQLHKLPAPMAERIAMRLKGAQAGAPAGAFGGGAGEAGARARVMSQVPDPRSGSTTGSRQPRGSRDFQQIVNRMPPVTLADFQKGDAVMIVSTEGTLSGEVSAITLLGGVEPILAASPTGSQAMTLSPWSLGSVEGDAATP